MLVNVYWTFSGPIIWRLPHVEDQDELRNAPLLHTDMNSNGLSCRMSKKSVALDKISSVSRKTLSRKDSSVSEVR